MTRSFVACFCRSSRDKTIDGASWTALRFLKPSVEVFGIKVIERYDTVRRRGFGSVLLRRSDNILSGVGYGYYAVCFERLTSVPGATE